MKSILTVLGIVTFSLSAVAHGVHPLIENYGKSLKDAYESALHEAGYSERDFDALAGISSFQDTTKRVRVVRYTFTQAQCAKNLEIYLKLDGSAYLAYKVVGCQ